MAIHSPLRSRRSSKYQSEITQQLIAFILRRDWFALPIKNVLKVVPMSEIYGDPEGRGVSLTIYQGCELLVVDVGRQIFGAPPSQDLAAENPPTPQQPYLLIVQSSDLEVFGLPIDSQPTIRRVPESSFTPIPATYVAQGNIQCVSSMVIPAAEKSPPLFLLDPRLIQGQ